MKTAVLAGVLLVLVHAAYSQEVKNVICPGSASQCPDGNTCCKLASGEWGCCPIPNAVCCSDHTHCCPNGYTCDTSQGTCTKGDMTLPWETKNVAQPIKVEAVICPGGTSQCPTGTTCCKLASGAWGCCPFPRAVCCSDHTHCCQRGYICNVAQGTCTKGALTLPWETKNVARPIEVEAVICPGGTSQCPTGTTCCKLASGAWGCCPFPRAVCCSDHTHCCQRGYICNVAQGTCTKGALTLPWETKNVARPIEVEAVICPGGTSQCPTGTTCCKLASGAWGCCPFPKAVCCSDHTHCCQNGYICNVAQGTCTKGALTLPWETKNVARPIEVEAVICPGGTSQCPTGTTCCKLASGAWGCCPFPRAVCCSDHTHCCQNGYICNVAQGTCTKGALTLPWETKNVARPIEVEAVICPGGTSQCPTGTTCCKLASGAWGCCPFPKAVCCSDHTHCCQRGYICNVAQGTCTKGALTLPWASKSVARPIEVEAVICPGGTSQCPTGTTCCKLASGAWGCCPFPKAVCCSDHTHCCQNGYICNVAQGTCTKGALTLPWETKNVAQPIKAEIVPWSSKTLAFTTTGVDSVVCDSSYQCPDGNTCCKLASGQWGCCPQVKAVCCSDGIHCCPNGYTCDVSAGTCSKSSAPIPWVLKNLALPDGFGDVQCDSTHQCPTGNTCCKLASGQWGCCPLPKATCCSDQQHCCPQDTTCDISEGKCNKKDEVLTWTTESLALLTLGNIKCDDTHYCPEGNTCCKILTGTWGCCPLPKASCCADMLHCCPNGYNCVSGQCQK
ncbi:progranulin-like isoform X5 [Asterias rubens]|uniref:progranulin-like isoform X5 n=1 Tax=Asterias rubens TaxID=7604 RepID=UPI00145574F1|nr:progranulin-like isoform X5 [Asterias rubens]